MLRVLKDLFDSFSTPAAHPADEEHQLRLATAVLLVEVLRADPATTEAERHAVLAALRRNFPLAEDELARLVELAQDQSRAAGDYYAFTSLLNDRFSQPQKVRVIEYMWQVAYADGQLDENENHVISKVAGLLHVTHGEYIAAKLYAKQASGGGVP